MPTPIWQPGTIYPPGALVQPASAPPPQPDQVTNGGFESGNTGWALDAGFSIGEFGNGTHFQGTWSLQWDLTDEGHAINANATEVTPGQTINGSCQVQQGASSSGQAGARCEILWYDASDEYLSSSLGNMVDSTSNQNWKQSSVSGVAPANAAFARFAVFAFRSSGGDELWVDNCSWDAVVSTLPSGLVFRAVQAVAGYSGSSEPVWPLVNGQTVVDNEVTWEAVFASRVVWEAAPVLVSGEYEPTWPTIPGGEVADGTIRWVAMDWRVKDENCPHGKAVAIGASKVFSISDEEGRGDIVPFSATTNCLDWSSEEDAGYLPVGLQMYGSNDFKMLGMYRGNLVPFNAEGYQMWQIDEDPANMAFLDASPLPCTFRKSGKPVANDYILCTPLGFRNIGIAGASTNLQAGFFGMQIDPLVLAKIRNGEEPNSLFWPAAGQYWGWFGNEAFVLTMNGGPKDQSWSRYVFPDDITDAAILNDDLYLRAGDLIWVFDDEVLGEDDQAAGTGGTISFEPAFLSNVDDLSSRGVTTFEVDGYEVDGIINSGTLAGFEDINIIAVNNLDPAVQELHVYLRVPDADARSSAQTAFFTQLEISGGFSGVLNAEDATFDEASSGGFTTYHWLWPETLCNFSIGAIYVAEFTPEAEASGTPFEGYIWWPYLDFGVLGIDKMLEGFDIVADGTFSVSIGWSQRDTSLATAPYALSGDTLDGSMVPMPLTAPSFQFRLTFNGSQSWEWFATNLYANDLGTG